MIHKRIIRFCHLASKYCSTAALLAIILLNSANLVSRWIMASPFEWVLEVSLILFVYSVMFVLPMLYYDNGFIRMHLVEEVLGKKGSRYVNLFADSILLIFMAFLAYQGFSFSSTQLETLSRGLGIPRFYVTIPLAVGALLSLPIGIEAVIKHLKELNNFGQRQC